MAPAMIACQHPATWRSFAAGSSKLSLQTPLPDYIRRKPSEGHQDSYAARGSVALGAVGFGVSALGRRFRRLIVQPATLTFGPSQASASSSRVKVRAQDENRDDDRKIGGINAVELVEATICRGTEIILNEVDLQVPRGARAVIVGPNGCGKTTFLSAVAGIVDTEQGQVKVCSKNIAWLRQEACNGSKKTVMQEAISEMPAFSLKVKLEAAEQALHAAEGNPEEFEITVAAYGKALDDFTDADGYGMEDQASKILTGLNFKAADFDKPCSELSGGWQMRVALARALLCQSDILLLDEPTNHMDASAKKWLASHLASGLSTSTTLLLVTHDRSLLQEISCTSVVEIAEKRILRYDVNGINEWEEIRENRRKRMQTDLDNLLDQFAKNQDFYARNHVRASTAPAAQSRLKANEKLKVRIDELKAAMQGLPAEEQANKKDANAEADGVLPLAGPSKVVLRLPASPLSQQQPRDGILLMLKSAKIGYEEGPPVVDIDELILTPNSRTALIGPNGCGKSTLLKTLASKLSILDGSFRLGVGGLRTARVALFTQDLAQELPADRTPIDYVLDGAPIEMDQEGARAALGALGLRSSAHKSPIGVLSGGEKARVALAVFTTRPADVLLMDEPTNHLDGAAVKALSAGLAQHTGAVLVASHDLAFIEKLNVTNTAKVIRREAGRCAILETCQGLPKNSLGCIDFSAATVPPSGGTSSHVDIETRDLRDLSGQSSKSSSASKLQDSGKCETILQRIDSEEQKLASLRDEMSANYNEKNLAAVAAQQKLIEELYELWETLEEMKV